VFLSLLCHQIVYPGYFDACLLEDASNLGFRFGQITRHNMRRVVDLDRDLWINPTARLSFARLG
jgi:hypothetical protein